MKTRKRKTAKIILRVELVEFDENWKEKKWLLELSLFELVKLRRGFGKVIGTRLFGDKVCNIFFCNGIFGRKNEIFWFSADTVKYPCFCFVRKGWKFSPPHKADLISWVHRLEKSLHKFYAGVKSKFIQHCQNKATLTRQKVPCSLQFTARQIRL